MYLDNSTQVSFLNRALGLSLAMFSMFVVGYTASRAFLSQGVEIESTVIPHQAAMWSDLGR